MRKIENVKSNVRIEDVELRMMKKKNKVKPEPELTTEASLRKGRFDQPRPKRGKVT